MSKREITVAWGYMREDDRFIRYDSTGNGTRVVVEREEPDLPREVGAMGYAVVRVDTTTYGDVFLVRATNGWIAPFLLGRAAVLVEQITDYKPAVAHAEVSYGDIRSVLTDYGVVLDPDDNLARTLMDLFKGEQ